MKIANDVTELIGRTPLVRLNRVDRRAASGRGRREAREPEPREQREGPHRPRDDRGRRARRPDRARQDRDRRADQRQHRHRARVRRRGEGLQTCILTMPETMSLERRISAARVRREARADRGREGHARRDREGERDLRRDCPNAFMPQQFHNPANPEVHRRTTAEEIWDDTDGKRRRARRRRRHGRHDHRRRAGASSRASRRFQAIAVEPDGEPGARRAARPGRTRSRASARASFPRCSTRKLVDGVITVTDDESFEMARRLAQARRASSAASRRARTCAAAIEYAKRPENAGQD